MNLVYDENPMQIGKKQQIHPIPEAKFPSGNAKRDILLWLSLPWPTTNVAKSKVWDYHLRLGGMEKICVMVQKLQLDNDGDGNLSSEELENESSVKVVERTLSYILNTGVVGALIFSVLFSSLQTPLSVSQNSSDFFDENLIFALSGTYYCSVYVSLSCSLWLIFNFVQQCTFLTAWFPNTELQLWYLSDKSPLAMSVVASYVCIIGVLISIPCCVAVAIEPGYGLAALLLILGLGAYLTYCILFLPFEIIRETHRALSAQFKAREEDKAAADPVQAVIAQLTPEEWAILDGLQIPLQKFAPMVKAKRLTVDTIDAWLGEARLSLQTRMKIAGALAAASG
jgi:hypothetical protein